MLLDTDVFSLMYVTPPRAARARSFPLDGWRALLEGKRVVISFQTRAELLSGIEISNWGERRRDEALRRIDATPTIETDDDVVAAYVSLFAEARRAGHSLASERNHVGDRWVAASAIAKDLPLLTNNRRHFENAPGLTLL